jgi:hypothetical protein
MPPWQRLCSASFALYHALRWMLLLRSDELPRVLA